MGRRGVTWTRMYRVVQNFQTSRFAVAAYDVSPRSHVRPLARADPAAAASGSKYKPKEIERWFGLTPEEAVVKYQVQVTKRIRTLEDEIKALQADREAVRQLGLKLPAGEKVGDEPRQERE